VRSTELKQFVFERHRSDGSGKRCRAPLNRARKRLVPVALFDSVLRLKNPIFQRQKFPDDHLLGVGLRVDALREGDGKILFL